MSNLGHADLGDSVRLQTSITNISDVVANVDAIMITVLDDSNNTIINTTSTNVSNYGTGTYRCDLYLNNNSFSEGSHYVVWSGYTTVSGGNFSYFEKDYFYIDAQ